MNKNNEIESLKHLSLNLYPDQMCVCIILICVYVITCVPLFCTKGYFLPCFYMYWGHGLPVNHHSAM